MPGADRQPRVLSTFVVLAGCSVVLRPAAQAGVRVLVPRALCRLYIEADWQDAIDYRI